MRRIPLLLSLLLASSAVLAQNQGVMILKSEQPYVSPFDKAPPGGRAPPVIAVLPAVQVETALQGEPINIEVREIERQETEKRAQAFVASKPPQRAPIRKVEPARKKEDTRVVAKKDEPKAAAKPALAVKEELKTEAKPILAVKEELKMEAKPVLAVKEELKTEAKPVLAVKEELKTKAKVEASVIPPKNAQNAKAELTLPPPALVVKENKLTSFSKESPLVAVALIAPVGASTIARSEEVPTAKAAISVPDATNDMRETDNFFPLWLLKAVMFFMIGGFLMSGGWYWLKRQALYGDPAFQDPWFRPVRAR